MGHNKYEELLKIVKRKELQHEINVWTTFNQSQNQISY